MMNNKHDSRPVFLNLLRIRQPVTAIASIGHRISGVLLFISLPYLIWLLDQSLLSAQGYEAVAGQLSGSLNKFLLLIIAWAAAHHFFAGIRFLLLDVDIGVELELARKTAKAVNVLGVVGVLVAMVIIL